LTHLKFGTNARFFTLNKTCSKSTYMVYKKI